MLTDRLLSGISLERYQVREPFLRVPLFPRSSGDQSAALRRRRPQVQVLPRVPFPCFLKTLRERASERRGLQNRRGPVRSRGAAPFSLPLGESRCGRSIKVMPRVVSPAKRERYPPVTPTPRRRADRSCFDGSERSAHGFCAGGGTNDSFVP